MVKYKKTKKYQFWKMGEKIGKKFKPPTSKFWANNIFSRFSRMYSFNLYNQIFYKNSRTWDFWSQSWDTQPDPILEDIQIGHRKWTTHANKLFEGVYHIIFTGLTDEKKTTTSNYQYFWSYGPISSYFWVLPPFMAMFLDHNLRTTDPNFMFVSIFRNVLRCLIHLKHENKGLPLNSFNFLG